MNHLYDGTMFSFLKLVQNSLKITITGDFEQVFKAFDLQNYQQ